MRILVVEDSTPTRELLARSLEASGFEVTFASRVATGRRHVEDGSFDVILLDIMLPDGSGLELCRELRARSRVPIIVISGLSGFSENSAVHVRDTSSGQRTVKVSAEAETFTSPCLTRLVTVTSVSPVAPYGTLTVIVRRPTLRVTSRSAGVTSKPLPGALGFSS